MKKLSILIGIVILCFVGYYFLTYISPVPNYDYGNTEQNNQINQNKKNNLFNQIFHNTNNQNNTQNQNTNNQNTTTPTYKGIFVATKWQKFVPDYVLTSPFVDGIFYRLKWNSIEKSEGVYDWSLLNSEFARIKEANKTRAVPLKVSIGIATGTFTPDYVYTKGAPKLSFDQFRNNGNGKPFTVSLPPPWNPVYMSAYNNLMTNLKNYLVKNNDYNLVSIIKLTGITTDTAEARLPAVKAMTKIYQGQTYTSTDAPTAWLAAGYTEQKIKDAWFAFGNFTKNLFPDKYLSMAIIPGHAFPDIGAPTDITLSLMSESQNAWKPNFIVQWNALNTKTAPLITSYIKTSITNGSIPALQLDQQALDTPPCLTDKTICDEAMFKTVMDNGLSLGMKYVEIFEQDVLAYPQALKYAHDILVK